MPEDRMTAPTPIDRQAWDDSVPAGDDFYTHVNGAWLRAHPVPPEYGSYGAFHEVNERNQELLHRLLHEAAEAPGEDGSVRHKVGDYFMAGPGEGAPAAPPPGARPGPPPPAAGGAGPRP